MALVVIRPGMLTTVQDRGRWGYQSRGVPVAGPMDPVSHRLANALVGNDASAAMLEVTLLGPELEFEDERVVAVAGAVFSLTIDGRTISLSPPASPFLVPMGARLRFGARLRGARAYLAIAGGIDVLPVLGSRATHVISAMGGFEGRAARPGDRLPLGPASDAQRTVRPPGVPIVTLPDSGAGAIASEATVRVLPGPQVDRFTSESLHLLQSAPYVIAQNSDRMGFRLEGPVLAHSRGPEIISDATGLGALQVPSSGQPILLMADRQTTGGYPKIATVITADLPVAAQLAPGDSIRFTACTQREAMAALIAQEQALLRVEQP
jgi:antagonist of KipI